jgi:hypothetical protein
MLVQAGAGLAFVTTALTDVSIAGITFRHSRPQAVGSLSLPFGRTEQQRAL